jgi:hypothetical protein
MTFRNKDEKAFWMAVFVGIIGSPYAAVSTDLADAAVEAMRKREPPCETNSTNGGGI